MNGKRPRGWFGREARPPFEALLDNTARALSNAAGHMNQRHIDNCTQANPAYGAGIAAALCFAAIAPTAD
ncbi:hypothetical protein D9599_29685 [Roseomonas sp. KE2513]|nr:hypothetical protein [Roseomonas sp. KE2513]